MLAGRCLGRPAARSTTASAPAQRRLAAHRGDSAPRRTRACCGRLAARRARRCRPAPRARRSPAASAAGPPGAGSRRPARSGMRRVKDAYRSISKNALCSSCQRTLSRLACSHATYPALCSACAAAGAPRASGPRRRRAACRRRRCPRCTRPRARAPHPALRQKRSLTRHTLSAAVRAQPDFLKISIVS